MPPTLADVLPSVAAAVGVGEANPLGIEPARDVVVLLVDGLGAELVDRHATLAPTLAQHRRRTLHAGFPATTAVSITSLAVGAPCAVHGIVGYSFATPTAAGPLETFNSLRWRTGSAQGPDARESHRPEDLQPVESTVARMARRGVCIQYVVPDYQVRSGLTRAAFRVDGTLHAADALADVRDGVSAAVRHSDGGPRFVYAYTPDLDAAGHLHGAGSDEWCDVLVAIDTMVADLMTALPTTARLIVTGDHGMVNAAETIDLDAEPDFRRDVALIAGEARVRHVYAERPEAAAEVVARWADLLGPAALVVSREQAIDERWFGPDAPTDLVSARIGDAVAAARGNAVLVCPGTEPLESTMIGHHGAWTDAEQLVPLITDR
ncbi:alkaline phosphatase family protein [Gordonia shandongensis]|uniref:alkaline phosphatase family protein n=1 Tax=Gordonia shandongensis TaxID=376351 RepID=UPI00047D9121|nr:nucleotide pyrophosphatase/phosphodiesterase family protein [Gordonia shandongensis]